MRTAIAGGVVLIVAAIALSFAARWQLALVVGGYLVLTIALQPVAQARSRCSTSRASRRASCCARSPAVSRSASPISPWFLIVAGSASLFMVTGKRHAELVELGDGAVGHRRSLELYSAAFLGYVRAVASSVTILAYCLWAFEKSVDGRQRRSWFELSIVPFVLGILRYALLARAGRRRRARGARALRPGAARHRRGLGRAASRSRCTERHDRRADERAAHRLGPHRADRARPCTAPRALDDVVDRVERCRHRAASIARGLGRSYGDAAQNARRRRVARAPSSTASSSSTSRRASCTVEAGVSLDTLHARAAAARLVPDGRARHALRDRRRRDRVRHPRQVPARLVRRLRRAHADRHARARASPPSTPTARPTRSGRPPAAWASPASITEATIRSCSRSRPSRIVCDTERAADLDDCMARMLDGDDRVPLLGRVDRLPRERQATRPLGAHARQPRARSTSCPTSMRATARAVRAAHAARARRRGCRTA